MTRQDKQLIPANDLISDRASMERFFQQEGYLYFRQLLDRDRLEALMESEQRELTDQGLLTDEGGYSGVPVETLDDMRLHGAVDYDGFWHSPPMTALFENVFGCPVHVYAQTWLRVMAPNAERYNLAPHQDSAYVGPHHEFRTCWVPLCDAPTELGGLELAVRSHVKGLREHAPDGFHESLTLGVKTAGVQLAPEEDQWISAEYRLGDAVIFHPYMVHRSALNLTQDQVRISMDTRVQPADVERGYYATHTVEQIQADARSKQNLVQEHRADA